MITFVKILNHSPAQDLSNKKTAAFCVYCGLRYSSDNLLSFDTNALYFVRHRRLKSPLKKVPVMRILVRIRNDRVEDPDLGSGAFLTPGSRSGIKVFSGSRIQPTFSEGA